MPHPSSQLINGKLRSLAGWKRDRPDHRDLILGAPAAPVPIPPAVDNSKNCSPVENQSDISSCTANSSTSAMEYLLIKLGRPLVELSRLYVYFFSRKVEGTPPSEDSGAYIRDVMRVLGSYGACRESVWPYIVNKFSAQPTAAAVADARNHKITQYLRCLGLDSIRHTIAAGYTAVGGFSVPQNMMSPECAKTGIVKYPTMSEKILGGHAVHFVGYDDNTMLLRFQNSWGKEWGDKGFGQLPYDFVNRNLASDFWTIRAEM